MDDYTQAVAEARTLVKRSEADQWRLAQLTWENASPIEGDGKKSLAEWSRDINVHPSYAGRLYRIWDSYQGDREIHGVSFSDAYNEISPASAHRSRIQDQPAAEKVAAIQEMLADPEVAQGVFADPSAKIQAVNAIHQASRNEGPASFPSTPNLLDIVTDAADIKHRIRSIARKIVAFNPNDATKGEILADVAEWEVETERVRNFLTGMNVDEVISKILEGV